jgi:hypothetical protein
MAGLAGVISHDRQVPVPADELDDLVTAYRDLRGASEVSSVSAGGWAAAARIDGDVPGTSDSEGRSWALAIGAIRASEPLCRAPVSDLDGAFAAVRYDARADRVAVISDPFGMQALYICERDGRTYFSTCATALARHLRAPLDPLGSALFLRAGYQFGPRTNWTGIERLGPAVSLSFDGGRPRRDVYWLPSVDPTVRRMTLEQTIDHCTEALRETVRGHLSSCERPWADLTGGFDSRLIAAVLASCGIPFVANTNGDDAHADVRLARRVAAAGGLEWHQFALPSGWAPGPFELSDAGVWGDGTLEFVQLGAVLWGHRLRGRRARTLVTGSGGEHVSARPWVQEFVRAGRSRAVNFDRLLAMRYLPPADLSALHEDPSRDVENYFRSTLRERAALAADEPNTTQLDLIYAYKSTGHFGAYRSASEASVCTEMPFYYRDVFTATFSAHHHWRNWHRLQKGMIHRLSPAMASVPTTLGGPAEPLRVTNAHRFLPYLTDAGRATVRKLRGRQRGRGSANAAAEWGPRYERVLTGLRAEGLLDPETMHSAELYDAERLTATLDRARRPDLAVWTVLSRIATLEAALRAASATSRNPAEHSSS